MTIHQRSNLSASSIAQQTIDSAKVNCELKAKWLKIGHHPEREFLLLSDQQLVNIIPLSHLSNRISICLVTGFIHPQP